ncbi:unnamed protein product [Sphagnum balticum]
MRKQQKHEGPTGAIVSGTPVYGSPVIGSPVVTGSPAATAKLSSDLGTAAPEDDAPAATSTRELPSAPPLYEASAPPYAGSPPAANASSVLHIDREAVAGPPAAKKPHIKLQNRKCQDIVFLILFIAFGIGFMIESSFGFNKGEPRRLVYGLDYLGNTCGDKKASVNLESFDVRYWQNPNQVYKSGVLSDPFNLGDARSICLQDCPIPNPTNLTWVCDYPQGPINLTMADWASRNYDYFDLLTPTQKNSSTNLTGPCYPVLFQSVNFFWSCQLEASPSNETLKLWTDIGGVSINSGNVIVQVVQKALSEPTTVVKRYVADLGRAWPVLVVCGGIAPLLLSVTWLIVVRYFAGTITWLTVILLNIFMLLVTVFFYIKAGWIGKDAVLVVVGSDATNALSASTSEQNHLKIVAVIMTILVVVVVLITLVMLKRVVIAVAVIKVAGKAIGAIPSLIIYPIFPFIVVAVFLIYWVAALLYLASAGSVVQNTCNNSCAAYDLQLQAITDNNCCGYSLHHSKNIAWAIVYHIFGMFWITQFINACCLTTIAGAIAAYYWARGETMELGWAPVLSSAKRVVHYSLGSMALGSLLVASIEMVRFIMEFIRKRLKLLEMAPGGCCLSILFCCAQCCLGCIEWTIKFINRNAYIVIATSGKGFCRAAGKATELIVTNILRVGAVNIIGDLILFLGKVCVSLACALFSFLMLDTHKYKDGHSQVSSPLFPVLFCWGIGYITAGIFFAVVEMAIDTILLSFCIDAEEHNGNAMSAPPLLTDTLSSHARCQEAAEAARVLKKQQRVASRK